MKKNIVLLLLIASPAQAEVYKCTGPGGVKFQKSPCQAAPMALKLPSPAMMEKIEREAERQRIADDAWRERKRAEEKHKAELRAINARIASENQWNRYLQQKQMESAAREQRWAHEDYCRHRQRISFHDGC
jgi:hypothetical protein